MNSLYLRLIAIGLLVLAVLSGIWYVQHLRSSLKEATEALSTEKVLNQALSNQLKVVTETFESTQSRLVKSERDRETIRSRVITRIQQVPAAPSECIPAMNWLVDRALEMKPAQ